MIRIIDKFIPHLEEVVQLIGATVLEIGCGDGRISRELSERCKAVFAIDPNAELLAIARSRTHPENVYYDTGSAENLSLPDNTFDVTLFSLSLHHVPRTLMNKALDEAVRVTKRNGHIVILEPGMEGSFFDAEILFDACDGDERDAKLAADKAMMQHPGLMMVATFADETVFQFHSAEDFIASLSPKENQDYLLTFLQAHGYVLTASRKVSVFMPA